MEKEELKKEIRYILVRSMFLDIAVYLVSVMITGRIFYMAAGLAAGTAGMVINLILLNRSVYRIVKYGNGNGASKKMFAGYIMRLAITGFIVSAAMLTGYASVVCTVIPFFYPKLIYAGGAFFRKEKKVK
ncbi:MAG: ATP synthase subunit I [Porcipelethomonas sp.]